MVDDYGDKTEAPTPRRRMEAREQGNIARSADLSAAIVIIAAMVMLNWYGDGLVKALRVLMAEMLGGRWVYSGTDSIGPMALAAIATVGRALAPLLIGLVIAAVLVNLVQVGIFFSPRRLQPRLDSLNPIKGISRLFGDGNGLVKLCLNLLKLSLVGTVAYSAVRGHMNLILTAQLLSFPQVLTLGGGIVYSVAIRIGMLLLILALLDYTYQRWRNEKRLRMTKQEVKDEMRRMEGDPRIKQRRRQIAAQRLTQRISRDVPTADVVVTDPRDVALAIRYDAQAMHAPRVVARGRGHIALMIRQAAVENGIPILERKPLANSLYKLVEVGQEIPEQFYSAVAEILAYVYEMKGTLRARPT
jgi:flagellar biosynthesis protein FlhB